ncbi:MAG TPA: ribosome-associated translation inhibitor RaiA [Thermoflexia bacterium]|nr:ribosome-associated translation inhibitor RaiA [Thermoflexia bacterium]
MDVQIYHRDLELTERLREYVETKMEKLDRYLPDIRKVTVDLKSTHVRDTSEQMVAQITMDVPRKLLRAEERAGDIFAAFDAAIDKLQRQAKRYKGRLQAHRGSPTLAKLTEKEFFAEESSREGGIVRIKEFEVSSTLPVEAVEQMELLGHYFFVFLDATDGRLSVVYKRHDDDYGMLKPVY